MPFTDNEKINQSEKLVYQLSGIANLTPGEQFWYNASYGWTPIVTPNRIWSSFSSIPPALTSVIADANVIANPTILEKRKIRLTLDITSNNRGYISRSIFNDMTSPIFDNWILPSLIRLSGGPSLGYGIRLYHGDPDTIGVELPTSYLSGAGGAPSWSFYYNEGIILTSTDNSATFKSHYDTNGLWIVGYRYIGPFGGGGVVDTPINQVAHGFNDDFIYHNGTQWVKAQADDFVNCATHFAIRIDDDNFYAKAWTEIDSSTMTDDASLPLIAGDFYYLSQTTPGKVASGGKPISGIAQSVLKVNADGQSTILIEEPWQVTGGGVQKFIVNQIAHGFDGDFIYHDGITWVKAQADDFTRCATHYAERIDDDNFYLIAIGEVDVTGLLDDAGVVLISGDYYYLSQTIAGKVSNTGKPLSGIAQSVLKANDLPNATILIEEPWQVTTGSLQATIINQVGHGLDEDFIYYDGTAMLWVKAQADDLTHCATHFARKIDDDNFYLIAWSEIKLNELTYLDDLGNLLIEGDYYYLSQTVAGKVSGGGKPTSGVAQSVLKANDLSEDPNCTILIEEPYNVSPAPGFFEAGQLLLTFTDYVPLGTTLSTVSPTTTYTLTGDTGMFLGNTDTEFSDNENIKGYLNWLFSVKQYHWYWVSDTEFYIDQDMYDTDIFLIRSLTLPIVAAQTLHFTHFITGYIVTGTTFSTESGGVNYTHSGDTGNNLEANAIDFNNSLEIEFYFNGAILLNGVHILWVSSTEYELTFDVYPGDTISCIN